MDPFCINDRTVECCCVALLVTYALRSALPGLVAAGERVEQGLPVACRATSGGGQTRPWNWRMVARP